MTIGTERSAAPPDASARSVALAVLRSGPMSRADLARRLGLSMASLTRLTRPMIDSGLLVEHRPEIGNRAGRPSRPLDIHADHAYFLGIKITWDALWAVVCDLKGRVIAADRSPVTDTSPEAIIAQTSAIIDRERRNRSRIAGIGIGVGGTVQRHRVVQRVPALGWTTEVDLAARLGEMVELPINVDNDVRALTQAELWFGEGRNCSSLVMITIGVGIGCAIVVDDRLYEGRLGLAAKVDHWTLDPTGPPCPRGHRGCADVLLTSASIAEQVGAGLDHPVGFEQVLGLAAAGDPVAGQTVQNAAEHLGLLIARVADVIAPDRILLTGDGIDLAIHAEQRLRDSLARHRSTRSMTDDLRILRTDFYDWARGAAAVAIRRHMETEATVT